MRWTMDEVQWADGRGEGSSQVPSPLKEEKNYRQSQQVNRWPIFSQFREDETLYA